MPVPGPMMRVRSRRLLRRSSRGPMSEAHGARRKSLLNRFLNPVQDSYGNCGHDNRKPSKIISGEFKQNGSSRTIKRFCVFR